MHNRSQTSSPESENEKPSGPSEQPSPYNSVNQIIPSPRPSSVTPIQTPHASTDQNITIQNPSSPQNDPQKDSSSEEENQIVLEVIERSRAISFGRPQEPSYLNILQREPPPPVRPAAIALDQALNPNANNRPTGNEDSRAVEESQSPTEAEIAQNLYVIMRRLAWFKFWRALVVYSITFAGSVLLSLIKERKITSFLGVYILAYVFLIYCLAENVVKSLSQDILPWKKVENICDAIDISIVIFFLLFIQLRSSGIQIPTKWVLVFYLFNMIGYFVKATSPESHKQFQVSKRLLVGIQFSLLAFKIDENLPWPWSVTLSFVILCLIFCVICFMIILILLLYILISPLLNRRVFIHVARSTLILGFLWLTLHSALWGFIMTGVIALAVHIDYNDQTSDSIINNCLLATKCLGVSLVALMIPAYNHILDHMVHFDLDKPFYEEELTPARESGRVSKFRREKKTTYLVRLSSTYFSPLNDSFKKKSGALKKLKRAGKQARNRKFQKKLANPEDSVNQDLKLDESVSIKDLITEKLRLDKIFNKEKGNNKKDIETQINPPKGYQEREFLSDENREKPVFSMADIKKVCLSEGLEAQGLSEEVRAKNSENLCYICFEKIPDAIFAECGHGGICTHCALEIVHIKGQCMQCRGDVGKVIRIEPNAQLKDIVKGYETLTIVTNK